MRNCEPQACQCEWCRKTEAEKISALLGTIEANEAAAASGIVAVGQYVRSLDATGCRNLLAHLQNTEQLSVWTENWRLNATTKAGGAVMAPLIKQRLLQLQAEAAAGGAR